MMVKERAKTFGRFGIQVNALVPGAMPRQVSLPTHRWRVTSR